MLTGPYTVLREGRGPLAQGLEAAGPCRSAALRAGQGPLERLARTTGIWRDLTLSFPLLWPVFLQHQNSQPRTLCCPALGLAYSALPAALLPFS